MILFFDKYIHMYVIVNDKKGIGIVIVKSDSVLLQTLDGSC